MARDSKIIRTTRESRKGKEVAIKLLGFTKVYFIHHAMVRMKERGITEAEVFAAIEQPDETGLKTDPPRKRVRKRRNAQTSVDVVYELAKDGLRVITAMVFRNPGADRQQRIVQRKQRQNKKR